MHEFTPEVLYADTVMKRDAYGSLSVLYAATGDTYAAVHAAFASDIQAVQAVMWERVMVASPFPDEQFHAIAGVVSRALAAYASNPAAAAAATAYECVQQARDGLAAAFDPAAVALLAEAYLPLGHLDTLPPPDPSDALRVAYARTKGQPVDVLAAKRRRAATERMSLAIAANTDGNLAEAMKQAWQADWAAYESYLLDAAQQIGDTSLITVEMRWMLATHAIRALGALPSDFTEAVTTIRHHMVTSLGTIEGERLTVRFHPLPD